MSGLVGILGLMARQSGTESLINSLRDGVIMFDVGRRVTLANPAAVQFTGLPKAGYDLKELFGLFASVDLGAMVDEALERQRVAHVDEVPVGRAFYGLFVTPLQDAEGGLIGGALVLHDITYVKQVDKMRRDFMNVAAHDLRTPMTAVKGFVQMIRRGDFGEPPTGEIAEALADVEEGADRMISLVNDFLTISRIEQGRFRVEVKACDIKHCTEQAIEEVTVTAGDRPIEIAYRIQPNLPEVRCDEAKITQVLVNLLDNALKHTEKGSIRVTVEKDEDPHFIRFTETNTGSSIPEKDLPHIFEQYFKGSAREVAPGRGGGLGLGLHIVKMIALM